LINNHRKPRTLSLWCCTGGTKKIKINNPFLILCSKNSSTLRTWLRKLSQTLESLRDSEIHAKRWKRRRFGGRSGAGKALGRRGLTKPDDGGGIRRVRARAARHCTGRWAPDAGFSGRCFGLRLVSTGRTSPDAAGTLFLRPVSAVWHTHSTGRTEAASGASSGAPLSTFSTKHHIRI